MSQQMGDSDGIGATARFAELKGITSDGAGNVYVADAHSIRKVVTATGAVTTLTDDVGAPIYVQGPSAVACDGAGYLYVADVNTNDISKSTVRKLAIATGTLTTVADRTGVFVYFDMPTGVTVDGAGNLYVVDAYQVTKVALATGTATVLAGGLDLTRTGSIDGTGAAASFSGPAGIAFDGAGNLFVSRGRQRPHRTEGRRRDRGRHHARRYGRPVRERRRDRRGRQLRQPERHRHGRRGQPLRRRRLQQQHP